jgi:hypothetical protein
MEELRKTKGYVEYALRNYPECRDSDDLLYERVCVMKGYDTRCISLHDAMCHRKRYSLPKYESVRRARQKVVKAFPELAGSSDTEAYRVTLEETYLDFARSVK